MARPPRDRGLALVHFLIQLVDKGLAELGIYRQAASGYYASKLREQILELRKARFECLVNPPAGSGI